SRREKELLPHQLQPPQAQAAQTNLVLEFGEQRFHFLSLPLCLGERFRVCQLTCALSGWFVLMDDKASEGSTGALWSERARATSFACTNVGPSMIAMTAATVVQWLACRTDIAIVFRLVGETIWT